MAWADFTAEIQEMSQRLDVQKQRQWEERFRRYRSGGLTVVALTESALKQDPLSGSLFVFLNRRRDRIKILYWGQTGFCIWYQNLE